MTSYNTDHGKFILLFCLDLAVLMVIKYLIVVLWFSHYISLMNVAVEHLFMWLLAICKYSLEKYLLVFCLIFNPIVELYVVHYIFWILIPYQIYDLKIISPVLWIAFSLCWSCHLMDKYFKFWCSPVYLFFLLLLYFCCHLHVTM